MTTVDCIIALFCEVDEPMPGIPKHPHATLWPSEVASPTILGVLDTYGMAWIHPIREGRSLRQRGRKGLSNHRWIVGGT